MITTFDNNFGIDFLKLSYTEDERFQLNFFRALESFLYNNTHRSIQTAIFIKCDVLEELRKTFIKDIIIKYYTKMFIHNLFNDQFDNNFTIKYYFDQKFIPLYDDKQYKYQLDYISILPNTIDYLFKVCAPLYYSCGYYGNRGETPFILTDFIEFATVDVHDTDDHFIILSERNNIANISKNCKDIKEYINNNDIESIITELGYYEDTSYKVGVEVICNNDNTYTINL